jgi:hypothetical protein
MTNDSQLISSVAGYLGAAAEESRFLSGLRRFGMTRERPEEPIGLPIFAG